MTEDNRKVFISYRRDVSWTLAQLVTRSLRERGYNVFLDVDSISQGYFDEVIRAEIQQRPFFLPLCVPGAFNRCLERNDWVLQELELAMQSQRAIVPLMANRFDFAKDALAYLPEHLHNLRRYNGLTLGVQSFDYDIARLVEQFLTPQNAAKVPRSKGGGSAPAPVPSPARAQGQPRPSLEALETEQLLQEASQHFEASRYEQALPLLQRILRAAPDHLEALGLQGRMQQVDKQWERAYATHSRIIELDPQNAPAYARRSYVNRMAGDAEASLADMESALRLNHDHPVVQNYLAIQKEAEGDLEGAIQAYNVAIHSDSSYRADYYYEHGRLHHNLNQPAQALESLSKALKLKPGYLPSLALRGHAYALLERFREAQQDFEQGLRIDRKYEDLYYYRAKMFEYQGQLSKAILDCNILIELSGKPFYHALRGDYRLRLGNYQLALEDIDRAIALSTQQGEPPRDYWYLLRAKCLMKVPGLMNAAFALKILNELVEKYPKDHSVYQLRAELHEQSGMYAQAAADYELFLAHGGLWPQGDWALRMKIAQLKGK